MTFNLRQLHAFVAVYEEGSFNRAAERENATQPGISTLVRNLEIQIGLRLFERTSRGVVPTQSGERLYRRATSILRELADARSELLFLAGEVSGPIKVGLIPSIAYSLLSPVLAEFAQNYPAVDVTIIEAYGSALTLAIAKREFDFAIAPADSFDGSIKTSFFGREPEFLVSSARSKLIHMQPVQLRALGPLKLILPTHGNVRRDRFEAYFAENGVKVANIISMDAMLATLDFITDQDWTTILPTLTVREDIDGKVRKLNPITGPSISIDYAVIEPRGQVLSLPAKLFLETLRRHFNGHIDHMRISVDGWDGAKALHVMSEE